MPQNLDASQIDAALRELGINAERCLRGRQLEHDLARRGGGFRTESGVELSVKYAELGVETQPPTLRWAVVKTFKEWFSTP